MSVEENTEEVLRLQVDTACCPRSHPNLYLSKFSSLVQGDTKKGLKNPTKIEEIQEKKLLTETEPLQLAF